MFNQLETSTIQLLVSFLALATLIPVIIIVLKKMLYNNVVVDANQKSSYKHDPLYKSSIVSSRIGLVFSLLIAFLCFSWTVMDKGEYQPIDYSLEDEGDLVVTMKRTKYPEPDIIDPPKPIKKIENIENAIIKEVEEDIDYISEILDVSDDVEDFDETIIETPTEPVAPPPLPKVKEKVPEFWTIVEQMPRFPACEDMEGSNEEKEQCAVKAMLAFLHSKVKYPTAARENGVDGTVVLQFKVDVDGSIGDIKVVRDPGAGLGAAARKVVGLMNEMEQRWTPGMQQGRPVKVLYTLPFKFVLN